MKNDKGIENDAFSCVIANNIFSFVTPLQSVHNAHLGSNMVDNVIKQHFCLKIVVFSGFELITNSLLLITCFVYCSKIKVPYMTIVINI